MARMIPPLPDAGNPSAAELRIFEKLRAETSRDWFVLHSLGLTTHHTKPWAEIDFVLVGPQGVYCLEVKGGRLSRQDGLWCFIDRTGTVHSKKQGPFEQVGGAAAALYAFLVPKVPELASSVTGYGVVTPDIQFSIEGPDVESAVVYDSRDLCVPISRYIDRLASYWHLRLHRGPVHAELDGPTRGRILELMRGDFDLRPSLRTMMGIAEAEFIRLTAQQCQILEGLSDNPRAIIRGGAGTGKSLLAVSEARRIAGAGRRVLLCCFNKLLAKHLASTLIDRPEITVAHFHGLLADLAGRAGIRDRIPAGESLERLFRDTYPQLCLELLLERPGFCEFDAIIVDEGQDLLLPQYVDVFDALLRGGLKKGSWRVFYDPNQNLFEALDTDIIDTLAGFGATQYRLTQNCRNTAPIGLTTSMVAGIEPDQVFQIQGPQVRQRWYDSTEEQFRLIADELRHLLDEGIDASSIVLLSECKLAKTVLATMRRKLPVSIVDLTSEERPSGTNVATFSTISGYKGLEADAVIFFGIDSLDNVDSARSLYVGASRAKTILVLIIDNRAKAGYERRAAEFGKRLTATF